MSGAPQNLPKIVLIDEADAVINKITKVWLRQSQERLRRRVLCDWVYYNENTQ